MKYYTIQENTLLIAENKQALTRFYDNVFELPVDYVAGKYIIEQQEIEEEIEVIDYDEEGNPIGSHTETITKTIYVLKENPDWEEEQLEIARQAKYDEALQKANVYQQNGSVEYKNCVFEMSDSNRKNLSDTEEALKLMGETETTWLDKDDNYIVLTVEDIQYIRLNLILAEIQKLWIVKYPYYKELIANATTADEVNAIEIQYYSEIPVEEE